MNTHVTVGGRTLTYPDPAPAVAAFLDRVRSAALDDAVTPDEMTALVYGPDNPLLDATILPGRAMVGPAAWADRVYHVMADLMTVKAVRLGRFDPERAYAKYTVDVPTAAARLGMTRQGVRAAIDSYRLAATYRKGQWWTSDDTLTAFEATRRLHPVKPAKTTAEADDGSLAVRGGAAGGLALRVRAAGADLAIDAKEGTVWAGRVPAGWTRCLLKLTTKGDRPGVRVFVLEPAPGEVGRVGHGELSVEGAFRIVEKVNNTKAANELWRGVARPVAAE